MATTLTDSFPFGGGSEVATDDDWRHLIPYLGCRSGVGVYGEEVADEFEVFADSTGAQVKVKAGECWIRGSYGYHSSEVTVTLGGTAPASGESRIDVIVLRLDLTNKRIEIDKLNGTPDTSGSETAPALTSSATIEEIPLAHVQVDYPGTTIAAGDVTDARIYSRTRNGWQPGDVRWWPANQSFPQGWGFADGVSVSRVTFSELADVVDNGGTGDFAKPDYRGEVLAGLDNMGTGAASRLTSMASVTAHYGAQTHEITLAELPDAAAASLDAGAVPGYHLLLTAEVAGDPVSLVQPTHMGYWLVAMRPV